MNSDFNYISFMNRDSNYLCTNLEKAKRYEDDQ